MQCMEVWGGNTAIDNAVSMAGLDAWVFSQPYQNGTGGGDLHYLSSCATGRVTRLLVADVSGHGEAIASLAHSLRSLLRRYINFVDQTRFVRSMNREFSQLADMGNFATAIVATYWCPTDDLVICNAGHPRPFLYRAKSRTWTILKPPPRDTRRPSPTPDASDDTLFNLPLGVAEPTGYDQFRLRLHPGDLVLLYTDALIESRNPAGALLGEQGLLALVQTLDAASPADFIPQLVARLRERAAHADPDDDATILLLRHNGSQPPTAILRGVLAPLRIARASLTRLRLGPDAPAPFPELSIPNILGAVIPPLGKRWRPGRRSGPGDRVSGAG